MVETIAKKKVGGLAGIVAGDSSICVCGAEDETLTYRGYNIVDLAKHASYEEVAWLLLRGELPTDSELKQYRNRLKKLRVLPEQLKRVLELIPKSSHMMDVLRTGCSFLGNLGDEHPKDPLESADRLVASFSALLLYWYLFHKNGKEPKIDSQEDTIAGYFLDVLHGRKPSELEQKALDVSLILYAEHEFNASTFTARTITSTLADYYSAVTGAIGALSGPLHGGANEKALELIEKFSTPQEAGKGVLKMLEAKELIMGFGHRVYTTKDPRSPIIKEWVDKLAKENGDKVLVPVAEEIEKVMWREKKLFPNVDFYSAVLYKFLNIPTPMFTPLFVISRIAGWSAHIQEQRINNKLIRPMSNYIGPQPRKWIPLSDR